MDSVLAAVRPHTADASPTPRIQDQISVSAWVVAPVNKEFALANVEATGHVSAIAAQYTEDVWHGATSYLGIWNGRQ